MPNKLRVLSGKEIVKFFGSHTKLKRAMGERIQTLVIPIHNEVAKGTLRDIYNQVLEYMPESEARNFFFTE